MCSQAASGRRERWAISGTATRSCAASGAAACHKQPTGIRLRLPCGSCRRCATSVALTWTVPPSVYTSGFDRHVWNLTLACGHVKAGSIQRMKTHAHGPLQHHRCTCSASCAACVASLHLHVEVLRRLGVTMQPSRRRPEELLGRWLRCHQGLCSQWRCRLPQAAVWHPPPVFLWLLTQVCH